ncbi:MAG: hypothetical protein ACTHJS_17400 [Xanthobacteraceae bacterium]
MLSDLLHHLRKTNPRLFGGVAILIALLILSLHKTQSHLLLIAALGIAYLALDLAYTLKTGRAHLRWSGTATRKHQPKKFWRYVHAAYFSIAAFAAAFLWAVFSSNGGPPGN